MLNGSISKNNKVLRDIVNRLFISFSGGEHRSPLLSSAEVFPESEFLEREFNEVKKEVMSIVDMRKLTKYEDIDKLRAKEVSLNWKLFYIMMLGKMNDDARPLCPKIISLIEGMTNVYNVSIAVLDPGVCLARHKGPYAGILRYHLGIKVPQNNPPHIQVLDQNYIWKEGESVVIDDVFPHEVFNESDEIRVILMVDFLRPMNKVLHFINRISLSLKQRWARHLIDKVNEK